MASSLFPPLDLSIPDAADQQSRNAKMKRLSPSCQQLVSERFDDALSKSTIVIRSCLADRELAPIVTSHKCNGCVLTPSGLNADMAITVAKHIFRSQKGEEKEFPGINVYDLEVHKPTVVKDIERFADFWIEMETTVDMPSNGDVMDAKIKCIFHSITPKGVRLQECGYCYVRFESYEDWLAEWSNYTHIILNRIQALHTRACKENNGDVQLVQRSGAYKLFESFVQYSAKYQNMSEVCFDTKTKEATAIVDLRHLDPSNDFTGPYYLDASCHLSGFVCNAVEQDRDKNAFISHGVSSMKLSPNFRPDDVARLTSASPLSPTTPIASRSFSFPSSPVEFAGIRTYVQMRPSVTEKSVVQGDVFVLQDGEIVGIWEGVRFKKIPRRVLNVFLPPPKRRVSWSQSVKN